MAVEARLLPAGHVPVDGQSDQPSGRHRQRHDHHDVESHRIFVVYCLRDAAAVLLQHHPRNALSACLVLAAGGAPVGGSGGPARETRTVRQGCVAVDALRAGHGGDPFGVSFEGTGETVGGATLAHIKLRFIVGGIQPSVGGLAGQASEDSVAEQAAIRAWQALIRTAEIVAHQTAGAGFRSILTGPARFGAVGALASGNAVDHFCIKPINAIVTLGAAVAGLALFGAGSASIDIEEVARQARAACHL